MSDDATCSVRELIPLLGEIGDLKRLSVTDSSYSWAETLFLKAWGLLAAGMPVRETALRTASEAVASVRLGGITCESLKIAGISAADISAIVLRSFREVAGPLEGQLRAKLEQALSDKAEERHHYPRFATALCKQPRAGATRPKHPRLILWPPESHGDHCGIVAVYAVLLAPYFGASVEQPFIAGLCHHLHNAVLPDGGFTGEELLGEHLQTVVAMLRTEALAELPDALAQSARESLRLPQCTDSGEAKAFHAADVIDRVLQMKWYEQAATFRLSMALQDMELVHAGPTQSLQMDVLRMAGLQ